MQRGLPGSEFVHVAVGTDSIVDLEIRWRTNRLPDVDRFLVGGLGARRQGPRWRLGSSWIICEEGDAAPDSSGPLNGLGLRYLTIQVRDVLAEHERLLDAGDGPGREPVRLGDTACISFVRAPDGTWIELSQRASLTGPLPNIG